MAGSFLSSDHHPGRAMTAAEVAVKDQELEERYNNLTGRYDNDTGRTVTHEEELLQSSVVGVLDRDPYAFNQISYPSDVTTNPENGHYMLFYVNVQNKSKYYYKDYDGYDVGGVTTTFTKGVEQQGGIQEAIPDSYSYGKSDTDTKLNLIKTGTPGNHNRSNMTTLSKSQQSARTGMSTWANTTTRISDSIALYLPGSIDSSLNASYDDATLGVIGFAAAAGLDFKNKFGADDFEGAAKALKGTLGNVGEEIIQRSLAGIADLAVDGADTYGLANKIFGRATNPYMEVIFKDMPLREFTYSFTFQPKDTKERDDVQNIIKTFRFHMAPELQEQNMRFMGIPSTFDIHYMYQSSNGIDALEWRTAKQNPFINKIATCVLKDCRVTYVDAAKSYRDGSSTQITMTLQFKETEMITKEKINQGF
jgi:hypothetical protein